MTCETDPVPSPGMWLPPVIVARTGSTNADLLAAAADGAPEGTVLVADAQSAGRGRLARGWVTLPGQSLACSVLLRPAGVPPGRLSWLPLLAGVAVVAAVDAAAGLGVRLKWPNDVLAGPAKLAGILAERQGDAVVIGLGLNLTAAPPAAAGGLPPACLADLGATVSRDALLAAILGHLGGWYRRWSQAEPPGDADASGLRPAYLRACASIGREVAAELPGGARLTGTATGVDPAGRLLLATASGPAAVSAGDVVHLR